MKFQHFLMVSLASLSLVACEGGVGEGGEDTTDVSYTISVDKKVVEANGEDYATFTVTDNTGKDVTADEDILGDIYFVNVANGSRLPRETRTFTSIRNGEYTFYASVKGVRSDNTVTIKVQNRNEYEKYLHKMCLVQLTGTWCSNCPSMTAALRTLKEGEYGENVILLASHLSDKFKYTMEASGKDLASQIFLNFGFSTGSVPNVVYDMAFVKSDRAQYAITSTLLELMIKSPATCGVKIASTSIDGNGNVTIEAAVKADRNANYDLAWAVLADNQYDSSGYEDVYNEVIVAASDNFIKMSSGKVALTKDQEITKTFTTKVTDYAAKDLKVVVFVHSDASGMRLIDNANECKLGESADYLYNE
ncbi:MAG: hypothetical protein J6U53_01900 [Tidjanibacter sp.]|nr:hypothetical protein [Tidjanibacter sp.]